MQLLELQAFVCVYKVAIPPLLVLTSTSSVRAQLQAGRRHLAASSALDLALRGVCMQTAGFGAASSAAQVEGGSRRRKGTPCCPVRLSCTRAGLC